MSERERIKFMHNYCKIAEDQQNSGVSDNLARNSDDLSEEQIKYLVENCSEPLVILNQLKWKILKWDLGDWCSILENEDLPCRCGKNVYSKCPQWETITSKKVLKISNFVELRNSKDPKEWIYFDYKYLKDWIINKEKIKKDITWKSFGYPDLGWQESTIWIGTEGAHTPCHVDTYGCNLVAQVLGRKLWCLFPPNENLLPTRVPYEESTIFSEMNFFSPQPNKFKGIESCRKVILNPGDVLFVPHGWWHYVENLEFAISINTWLPTVN
ncbi:HSPB1-associated protein 1 isoform X2 [Agrilus planipennis]|uniref:HSPB1-associated protein 1 isoform X2 n=1 Tax=Agrilus planipennis TaxID=224129 RepID=A0A7F5RAF3_AGRPL|nr:HSPB1-associated protein 1 isoform X2 [Agrilus planipennis]